MTAMRKVIKGILILIAFIIAFSMIKVAEAEAGYEWIPVEEYRILTLEPTELYSKVGKLIATIPEEQIVKVYEEDEDLLYVQWQNRVGFIRNDESALRKLENKGVLVLEIGGINDEGKPESRTERWIAKNIHFYTSDYIELQATDLSGESFDTFTTKDCLRGDFVEISKEDQSLLIYKNFTPVLYGRVVTGSPGENETPEGIHEVIEKLPGKLLRGEDYRCWVHFWIRFYKNYGIHDADDWRSVYGGEVYKTRGSHGCVNASYDLAKTTYEFCEIGMPVIVA